MSNDWLELVGTQRAACCCKELGVAALRHAHNLSLPVVRDNLGYFQVRVASQHPSSPLLAGTTWQGHAVKIGGLARAAVESDLGAADTTQGRLCVLRGQFQDPVPSTGAELPHHNTLTRNPHP